MSTAGQIGHGIAIAQGIREAAPVVRLVDSLGYDEASESWLFGKFGYTSTGKRITANSYGYFEEILVRCRVDKEEKLLDQFEEQPLKPALDDRRG